MTDPLPPCQLMPSPFSRWWEIFCFSWERIQIVRSYDKSVPRGKEGEDCNHLQMSQRAEQGSCPQVLTNANFMSKKHFEWTIHQDKNWRLSPYLWGITKLLCLDRLERWFVVCLLTFEVKNMQGLSQMVNLDPTRDKSPRWCHTHALCSRRTRWLVKGYWAQTWDLANVALYKINPKIRPPSEG